MAWLAVGLLAGVDASAHSQAATSLMSPAAIVFDSQGNLYFAEPGNHVVRKFSAAGSLSIVAGNGVQGFAGDGGAATAAELDSPQGLALDAAGDLFIADTHNHRVREVAAATGTIFTVAGTGAAGFSGDGGAAQAAALNRPTALALDAAGDLYVADTGNHRVRRIAAGSGVITAVAGNGTQGFAGDGGPAVAAAIDSPGGLAVDAAGNLFIADTRNGRVREVNALTGVVTTVAGTGGAGGNIQSFSGDGGASAAAGLALPRGLALDTSGNLYIADSANHRVRRISASGVIATVAGQGTEGFAGDGAPAIAANLDSPQSVALSPGGLLTMSDTANQRIRQLDAQPAPGPDIHTVAGVGAGGGGTMTLSGPATALYGSGAVTATLNVAGAATGSVTFSGTSGGVAEALGSATISGDVATLSLSGLAVGTYSVVAAYAGDATHAAMQSAPWTLTVEALPVTAAANAASISYGQPVPALTGTLSGVLAQDAGKVAAVFLTTAGALSPVGTYPITAQLTGAAAGNYTLTTTPVNLTITQARSVTTLTVSPGSASAGTAITLTVNAASTTSGVPTGRVTLLDGSTLLAVVQLAGGSGSFTTSTLASGAHSLSAAYSGDTNFLASTSQAANVTVTAGASDFSLASSGATSQSVAAGDAATFNFSVGTVGTAIASPIALSVQGLPIGASGAFTPSYVPPGGGVTSFALTVQTPVTAELRTLPSAPQRRPWLAWMALPLVGLGRVLGRRRGARLAAICVLGVVATMVGGCGNRVNTASESTSARTYTLTVTGTATSASGSALTHSVNVTLQVL